MIGYEKWRKSVQDFKIIIRTIIRIWGGNVGGTLNTKCDCLEEFINIMGRNFILSII